MALAKWDPKDPNDVADYWFNWDTFLPDSETITAATVTVPDGLTSVADDFDAEAKRVRVRLSGGEVGGGTDDGKYPIDCLITTDAGQVFEITKPLQVKERTV